MTAKIIDCVSIAEKIKSEVKADVETLQSVPHLAVIIVGEDPASQVYVRNKERVCGEVGIKSSIIRMPKDCTQDDLNWTIKKLNSDRSVHGILLQLPLPKHLDETIAIELIRPEKDVDGLHPMNAGLLSIGSDKAIVPCTPQAVMRVFKELDYDLTGKDVVILGRSNLFGKPMAQLVLQANGTPVICHSKSVNTAVKTSVSDVFIAAIGQPKMIDKEYVGFPALGTPDVVIDVGINRTEDGLCGDVNTEEMMELCDYITPVPKGIGVLTVASLMKNVLKCFQIQGGE